MSFIPKKGLGDRFSNAICIVLQIFLKQYIFSSFLTRTIKVSNTKFKFTTLMNVKWVWGKIVFFWGALAFSLQHSSWENLHFGCFEPPFGCPTLLLCPVCFQFRKTFHIITLSELLLQHKLFHFFCITVTLYNPLNQLDIVYFLFLQLLNMWILCGD